MYDDNDSGRFVIIFMDDKVCSYDNKEIRMLITEVHCNYFPYYYTYMT